MRTVEIKTLDDLDVLLRVARDRFEQDGAIQVEFLPIDRPPRSSKQNRSLHLYCQTIAKKMNEAGYTQRQLVGSFKEGFELPVTMEMIKDIFREVGKAMYHKDSTAKLNTVETQEVYRVIDQRFGEITGCRAEWPSIDSLMEKSVVKKTWSKFARKSGRRLNRRCAGSSKNS